LSYSPSLPHPACIPVTHTKVANTGASGIYFGKHAPVDHCNTSASSIRVGIADGTIACSSASAQLKLKKIPPSAHQGNIMPTFSRTLVGISPLCNADLTVTFTKHLGWEFRFSVPISGTPIVSGIPIPFLIPKIPVGFFF
jgi:hypothetical protein